MSEIKDLILNNIFPDYEYTINVINSYTDYELRLVKDYLPNNVDDLRDKVTDEIQWDIFCALFNPFKANIYHKLFNDNLDLFQLVYIYNKYLFSHAGVYEEWLKMCDLNLDNLINYDLDELAPYLNVLDSHRGGLGSIGSCIWADIRDSETEKLLKGYYHIFGHTQLKFKVSTSEFSCLDCRVPFSLDSETGYINKLIDIPTEW